MYDTSEYMPISDNIMVLRDQLSGDIIRINLETQMDKDIIMSYDPPNYLLDILERRAAMEDDFNPLSTINEKDFIDDIVLGLFKVAEDKLSEKFGVEIGEDLEFMTPQDYMDKIEILYEFFFIRHYENLKTFILHEILTRKNDYYKQYKEEVDVASKANTGDVYVRYSKEKYRDMNIVTILYKLKDIIIDIKFADHSIIETIDKIITLDPYEECNFNIDKMFLKSDGKEGGFNNDTGAYKQFMGPLRNDVVFDRLLNDVKLQLMDMFERVDMS